LLFSHYFVLGVVSLGAFYNILGYLGTEIWTARSISMALPPLTKREQVRESAFSTVWSQQLNDAFKNFAPYYDRGNQVASLGCWNWFLRCFMSMIELRPEQRVLDVCAGTNAIGIALLKREPTLEVHAIDRSTAMQEVVRQRAKRLGFHINSVIADVHTLPFPDNHFVLTFHTYNTLGNYQFL
jgi:demethylmenaquinone methyltransferase/2-methoxy-6-polyprenyl-1,4-benzoquinol methylase